MKGEGGAKAQVTFKQGRVPRSQVVDDLASALDFAVRLLQSHGDGEITDVTVRDALGEVAFSHDEIERLSALVRLSSSEIKPKK